jgi:hypothetical protein
MSNPNGVGGYAPGQSGNPNGRPRSASTAQLYMLRYFREATDLLVQLMRSGTKEDAVRLAAIREVLDRGLGKAPQAISVDLMMGKQLSDMSQEELLEFKAKYVAMTTLAPAAIDEVIAAEEESDEPKLLELPLDSE